MRAFSRGIAPFALALLVARGAAASERRTSPRHVVSLSLDLPRLLFWGTARAVRLQSEVRLPGRASLAMIVGYGLRAKLDAGGYGAGDTRSWEAALNPRYYFLGSFEHGAFVGATLSFVRIKDGLVTQFVGEPAPGVWAGPTIGAKATSGHFNAGFEFGPLVAVSTPSTRYMLPSVAPYGALTLGMSF
jgi:hypothetical protein